MGVLNENLSDEARMLVTKDAPEIHGDILGQTSDESTLIPSSPAPSRAVLLRVNSEETILGDVDEPASAVEESIAKWTALELKLTLDNVSLSLFLNPKLEGLEADPVARFDFIDSSLSFSTFTDGTSADGGSFTEMYSKKIIAHDTRKDRGPKPNLFRDILSPMKGGGSHNSAGGRVPDSEPPPQLQITYRSGVDKATVHVILNEARVFFAVDWFSTVKKFLFTRSPNQLCSEPASQPSVSNNKERFFNLVLSITHPEFVLCVDNQRQDTDAIVLKFSSVLSFKSEPFARDSSVSKRSILLFDLQVWIKGTT